MLERDLDVGSVRRHLSRCMSQAGTLSRKVLNS